jgi:hypothetical protein
VSVWAALLRSGVGKGVPLTPSGARRAFAEERLSPAARWMLASEGTAYWLGYVARRLGKRLGDDTRARNLIAQGLAPAWRRRYDVMKGELALPDLGQSPDALPNVMLGLHPGPIFRANGWLYDGVGGAARGLLARRRADRWLRSWDFEARWREVTVHLGEMLITLTDVLPAEGLGRTSAFLGEACHAFGVQIARGVKWTFDLPDGPESAIEVLRMGEYVFRVNPEHSEGSDAEARTGFLEGNACPWYPRPGWGGMHCGIFGRFQDGCASVFGLNYRLDKTIPRHGGDRCRVELSPIPASRLLRDPFRRGAPRRM